MTNSTHTMNDTQLRVKAIALLKKELGMATTLRFLALMNQNSTTDYVEISRQIYEEQQLDEIFTRAKQNWKS
ncbi:MAG: hypothetical protein F6K21_32500 [Symploca sp. SIO2D2]|nr:hypothetical protein [Symploca sp. SIO2D2]NER23896.1 hypothetical protein [Symploca sp. SIO1C2]